MKFKFIFLLLLTINMLMISQDPCLALFPVVAAALALRARNSPDLWKNDFYPGLELSTKTLETLNFLELSAPVTPSGESQVDVHFEVKRLTNRRHNYELLLKGDQSTYRAFTRQQEIPMTWVQFKFLSDVVQSLDPIAQEVVLAVTAVRAVPLTSEVVARATALDCGPLPKDSVSFMAQTMADCPEIYPVYEELDEAGRPLFRRTMGAHGRHIAFGEGDLGMFEPFEELLAIEDVAERLREFKTWFTHWLIVDISGFSIETDPRKDPRGSLYLNQHNTESIIKLYQLLEAATITPSLLPGVYGEYLDFRADQIGFTDKHRLKRAQIAAWLEVYTSGSPFTKTLVDLDLADFPDPTTTSSKTPTYGPALFKNALSLNAHAFPFALKIYTQAMTQYHQRISLHPAAASGPPLSFRLTAAKESLREVMKADAHAVTLDNDNNVIIRPMPKAQASPLVFARALPLFRYNIVLVPEDGNDDLVRISQERCAAYSPEYILDGKSSLAHVSVCQIETARPISELQRLLETVASSCGDMTTAITFKEEVMVKPGSGPFNHVNWIELVPEESAIPQLQRLHKHVLDAASSAGFLCKNPHGSKYQPHATLGNVLKQSEFVAGTPLPEKVTAKFKLVLGVADQHWQLNRVLPIEEVMNHSS